MDWYEEFIEEPIRPLVRLLRDNGFNTECSCGHEMYAQIQYMMDGSIERLHRLLFDKGLRNYTISLEVKVIDGHSYNSIDVRVKEEEVKELL